VLPEYDRGRLDTDLNVILKVLACVDRVCGVSIVSAVVAPERRGNSITVMHGPPNGQAHIRKKFGNSGGANSPPGADHEDGQKITPYVVGDSDPCNDQAKVHTDAKPSLRPIRDPLQKWIDEEAVIGAINKIHWIRLSVAERYIATYIGIS
jgi:hypothetical protein